MEGDTEIDSRVIEEGLDSSFVWDEPTQLYFHARSGFYHDPAAGWYYCSKDGQYYKFENGSYILLEYNKENECESHRCSGAVSGPSNSVEDDSSRDVNCLSSENMPSLPGDQYDETTPGNEECNADRAAENPPPPSEWLEETLINMYLSGYKQAANSPDVSAAYMEVDDESGHSYSADGTSHDHTQTKEDVDWISEDQYCSIDQSDDILNENELRDEENWKSQYGHVVHSGEQPIQDIRVVDLWDWSVVKSSKKDRKGHSNRLVGRLVKKSVKFHPSMPSKVGVFKTAPICEAYLNLVRVRTGQVYRLHNPSAKYLTTLSNYDSSNPTKEWGFPELSVNNQEFQLSKSSGRSEPREDPTREGISVSPNHHSTFGKKGNQYRDRAAERRALHHGFGAGPGQKSLSLDGTNGPKSPISSSTELAAAESLTMSFGAGSYARKLLENMGWKEGEALGITGKGLIKPIEAVGNVGNAGLGWSQSRKVE